MRTQFGKLVQKKSGDGARELTEREKWIIDKFSFLQSHIVRIAGKQAGLPMNKLGSITSTAHLSDESDMGENEENSIIDNERDENPSQSTAAATSHARTTVTIREKRKKKSVDTELQELIDKLTERVEDSREMREKVADMIKAVENPHTAYANYLASMHPSIHPDLWEDYLRKSHDTLMFFVAESKRMRKNEQQRLMPQQMQPQIHPYRTVYSQLQPMVPQQPQQSNLSSQQSSLGHGTQTSGEMWDTASSSYGNPAMSAQSSANLSRVTLGSLVRELDDMDDQTSC